MDRAANVFNLRGVAYFRLGQYELAINEYAKALEIEPNYADALNNMGSSLNKIKKTEQALSFFDRAIVAKPNFSHAYNNAGNALQNIGKLREAIARYETAVYEATGKYPCFYETHVPAKESQTRNGHLRAPMRHEDFLECPREGADGKERQMQVM